MTALAGAERAAVAKPGRRAFGGGLRRLALHGTLVILSAALKGISPELLEAARVDGATEWQVFRRIVFPLLTPTIAVVSTTMVITALKAFDIVYVMTNGNFDTDVIANRMYKELFSFGQPGRASATAVILLALVIPIMVINIRQFRYQEAIR